MQKKKKKAKQLNNKIEMQSTQTYMHGISRKSKELVHEFDNEISSGTIYTLFSFHWSPLHCFPMFLLSIQIKAKNQKHNLERNIPPICIHNELHLQTSCELRRQMSRRHWSIIIELGLRNLAWKKKIVM